MAAGATVGSNHNSRGADGELQAGRGFWPGLCVSLKHNSRFATFTMIAKGDYPAELDIPLPFSLVSQDLSANTLQVMPAYWFMHNMYALARNEWKYSARDQRKEKIQRIETAALAPDSVNEMIAAMDLLREATGKAYLTLNAPGKVANRAACVEAGRKLLDNDDPETDSLVVLAEGLENSKRPARLLKVRKAYQWYRRMIRCYALGIFFDSLLREKVQNPAKLKSLLRGPAAVEGFMNIGGQLIPESEFLQFRKSVRSGRIKSWSDVHDFYRRQGAAYDQQRFTHAMGVLANLGESLHHAGNKAALQALVSELLETKSMIFEGIVQSRQKDYQNRFRKMMYDTPAEMDRVVGAFSDNTFIEDQRKETEAYAKALKAFLRKFRD
jgi:hypothetical protein